MPEDRAQRIEQLKAALKERILVFDGAMGTSIQALDLAPEQFGGDELDGCNENLSLVLPEAIRKIHEEFLDAGADIIETNTFGGTPLVLDEYELGHLAREQNRVSAQIAREAAAAKSTPEHPRFVAGSMGPTTKSLSVTGGATFDEMADSYKEQAIGLLEGGSDFLLVETSQDTRNIKSAIIGIQKAFEETGQLAPIMVSGTIEPMGTMLAGQGVEALYASLEHIDLLALGLNCATGPKFMTDHLRTLSGVSRFPVSCIPNAGLPDEDGNYNESPEEIATVLTKFAEQNWINIVGGCCGTTPAYTRALADAVKGLKPRSADPAVISRASGIDHLSLEEENRPIIVGERTNVIGSRKFKRLIREDKFEEAAEIGRKQVRGGAHIIDVCLADPDREELEDMTRFLDMVVKKVKVPLMLDSTDAAVLEESLKYSQGKAIINSINLEDGEERFEEVVPLARLYGAALVVGCIDEDPDQGMAVTRQRKLEVAQRSYDLLVNKYGIPENDIIFDPLVFPCATGDEAYVGSAIETIEGVRMIREKFPRCKTILGVSNVSFGLPNAGREVLNSVFLYLNVKAGLDLAIVNSEKLMRYASIPDEERVLAEDLLFNRGEDPIAAFANFYRNQTPKRVAVKDENRPLEQRLADYIIEGSKDGLIEDLELARKDSVPLKIINGPLMAGMDEVGRLFNNNELIVAEVLQSAEAMKAAVSHLEQFMEKSETSSRGKMILATVKGDVHDIGKNLVEIILGNNGFEIVNLGIKVPPQKLIDAVEEHKPDLIGLSGLLVKSAQQMVVTATDLREAGVDVPILVGGAALTKKFTQSRIAPEYKSTVIYARDAMDGLDICNRLMDPEKRDAIIADRGQAIEVAAKTARPVNNLPVNAGGWSSVEVPQPPDLKLHVVENVPLTDVFDYVNPAMLFGKHLGLRGSLPKLLEEGNEKAITLHRQIEELKDEVLAMGIMQPRGIFQFHRAWSEGDSICLGTPDGEVKTRFDFPRQPDGDHLCLADWIAPKTAGTKDYLATFVTSCGQGVRKAAEAWKEQGEYFKSHALQALAIESAEGFAELLHTKLRQMWGFPDGSELSTRDVFQAKYQGIRVSFGYPACPNLEDQGPLWKLIEPDKHIGVELTDGFMMEPEASVSALVFHHPQARYFSVREMTAQPNA
ncbi:MAG: methionine synthase [Candidatus Eisenbacteria bacterium]|uniref:Methionine synthase n=1 Tax=Eiseniibacteriota bacterium TaxID=2212470 RepID=A0A7Y2E7A4_UNCEI|nr:methionine synthase [Candidatus Eisenbacteria bacterium]